MRVAFFVKVFPPRHETFVLNQLRGLRDLGIVVDVIAQTRGAPEQLGISDPSIDGSQVIYRSESSTTRLCRYFTAFRRLTRIDHKGNGRLSPPLRREAAPFLKGGPYDVVHCQFATLGAIAVSLRDHGVFDAPVITSVRGFDLSRRSAMESSGFRKLLAEGDLFLPVCDFFRQRLIELGVRPERVIVHRSGIDVGKLQCDPDGRRGQSHFLKEKTGTVPHAIRLLSVARLVEKKGIEYAIRAAAHLDRRGLDFQYTIIGDGPLRSSLEQLTQELGLSDRIKFLGWLPHDKVVDHLQQTHIVVNPSVTAADGSQEGIPNTLKEAMACGLPVVATRHSGIPELVEDGVSGYLVAERDAAALADALAKLIGEPETRREMGTAGRCRVVDEYNMNSLNDELAEIYRQVVTDRPQQRSVG